MFSVPKFNAGLAKYKSLYYVYCQENFMMGAENTALDNAIRDLVGAETNALRVAIEENGMIAYASASLCRIVGMTAKSARGKPLAEILDTSDAEIFMKDTGSALFSVNSDQEAACTLPETGHQKVTIKGEDKVRDFHFEWIKIPGGKRYLIGSTDSAGKRKKERVLNLVEPETGGRGKTKTSATREESPFIALSHEAMTSLTPEGFFQSANPVFTEMLGYSVEQLRKWSFTDLVVPDDRHMVRNSLMGISRTLSGRSNYMTIDFEARMLGCEGEVHCIDWRFQRNGKFLYGVGRDLTNVKNNEAKLLRRESQLKEAEKIGRMGHWHWIIGEDRIGFSDAVYSIFGLDRDKFTPTIDNLGELVHKRDMSRLIQVFQRSILEGNDYDLEFRVIRPNGETRYVRCQGRCELDDNDEVIGLFGIMQDITERTIYEINLREAKEKAERAYAAKSQFLANMSHELRTPLNAIIGFSEMIQQQLLGPVGNEKYLEYIGGIRESGEHLLDLISDILNMSKIEAGKYELDLEKQNLTELIELAVNMINGKAYDAGLKITKVLPDEKIIITADRRAVMQILLNLLSNAVKFTDAGGEVRIECAERQEYVSLKVIDNGIGIPPNKLKAITRPFEQAASSMTRNHEGSGLGLAITKELAEMHGGAIHIDSVLDEGTAVTVRLPYNAEMYYGKKDQD